MIPFNRPSFDGQELAYLSQAVTNGHTSGNGSFTRRAEAILADKHLGAATLLTTSCTHALEMAARLIQLRPDDEVIVPSFSFVSTASAFLQNGARPVFADIRADTMNVDPSSVERLITRRTRAICIVHYAGVGADPDVFAELAARYEITLIEDNAHGLGATWNGKPLGTFGAISTLSFHETKNFTCGEGGAIILNDSLLLHRAEILREKGTDRSRFLRGQVDKYTWVDNGSSWVMSDLLAAVLVGQLERFEAVQSARSILWDRYESALGDWARGHGIGTPFVPDNAQHPAHIYYMKFPNIRIRDLFISHMKAREILVVFHYQPLHLSPMAVRSESRASACLESEKAGATLVRLPLYASMTEEEQRRVIDAVLEFRFC